MKLIYQHAPATPVTRLGIILPRTGVCLDPPGKRGLTRLTTRLMFRGAGGLSNEDINAQLERLGANMWCSLSNDVITFRLVSLSENLGPALALFLKSIHAPNFEATEFNQLTSEIISGWISDREESSQLRAQEAYLEMIFGGTPTGFLPDGTLNGLQACTLDDVRAQYQRFFHGERALLAVLSNLGEEQVERDIADLITLPSTEHTQTSFPWDGFVPNATTGRRVWIVPDAEPNTNEIVAGSFCAREDSADWHIHRVISFIFGGDMNSRLFRILRGEHGFSYGASCWYESAQGRTPRDQLSPFSLYTFPAIEYTERALPMLMALYEELVEKGVTGEELELARKALTLSYPFLRDTPNKLLSIKVGEALYGMTTDDDETNQRKLDAMTPEDVLRVLHETHHPDQLEMVLMGDPKHLEPLASKLPGVTDVEIRDDSPFNQE